MSGGGSVGPNGLYLPRGQPLAGAGWRQIAAATLFRIWGGTIQPHRLNLQRGQPLAGLAGGRLPPLRCVIPLRPLVVQHLRLHRPHQSGLRPASFPGGEAFVPCFGVAGLSELPPQRGHVCPPKNCQLSTVNCQLRIIVHCQLSIVNFYVAPPACVTLKHRRPRFRGTLKTGGGVFIELLAFPWPGRPWR